MRELRLHEHRVLCEVRHEVRVRAGARPEVIDHLRALMPAAPWR